MLLRGSATFEAESARWLIPAGRCVWVPPRFVHVGTCAGQYAGWIANFSAGANADLPDRLRVISASALLSEVVCRIATWSGATDRLWPLYAVLRDEINLAPEHTFHLPMPTDPRLNRVARALIGNVADPRSVEDWARWGGLGKRTLTRIFKQDVGLTFDEWRRHLRIFHALHLLAEQQPIAEVASAVGYDTASAFTAMFRSVLGASPRSYMARHSAPVRNGPNSTLIGTSAIPGQPHTLPSFP